MSKSINIQQITLIALMAALVLVLTRFLQVPIPATQGYVHLGDAGITFAACAFGPWVAAVAGGLGTMLADLTSGYAEWAVFSLLVHGVQGWVMGWLLRREVDVVGVALAVCASSVIVVGGYFVAGTMLMGMGKAASEIVPNLLQVLSGGVVGVPLYLAVRRAYPPVTRYRE